MGKGKRAQGGNTKRQNGCMPSDRNRPGDTAQRGPGTTTTDTLQSAKGC